MNIDAAEGWHIQHLLGQDPPVGHHGAEIGLQRPQLLHSFLLPEGLRLEHGDPRFQGDLLRGRGRQLHAPALGPVRLGVHAHHFKAVRQDSFQAGSRNVRRAHKHNAHAQPSPFSSSSVRKRSITSV